MLVLIFIYSFTVPYQLGVSGGVHLLRSVGWFVVTVCMNTCYFVDTFLHFFRAYREDSGRMVIDPKSIRKNYLRGLFFPNLLSNLPTTIAFYVYGQQRLLATDGKIPPFFSVDSSPLFVFLRLSDILKLLRLRRASRLLATSEYVKELRERKKPYTIQLWTFIFLIVAVAHWFACIWCGVAFIEARGFGFVQIKSTNNWINLWYTNSYVEGGLDPIGWDRDTDRYVLSLFWAIQTITSIGYGNIVPLTAAEWWIGSVLQLMAGMLWAYVIGGLVGVVTAMEVKKELFRERIDRANNLISIFFPEEKAARKKDLRGDPQLVEKERVAMNIRRYIYTQSERPLSITCFVRSLEEAFPVLETLSPELQRSSCLMLMQKFFERVPYLSSRFLSSDEQSIIATRCVILELPCGETFHMQDGIDGYGRGILVQRSGLVTRQSKLVNLMPIVSGGIFGADTVLLEDGSQGTGGEIHILSFSVMVFIPRQAIVDALARNPAAWNECACWKYFGACLVEKAAQIRVEMEKENGVVAKKLRDE